MQFASQRMEIKIRKLGIIAGDGDLPIQIINECKKQKKDFVVILINGHGTEISKSYNPDYIMNLSKIGKAIKFAKTNNIIDLVMAGRIKRPSLKDMLPDIWTARFLAKYAGRIKGDNNALTNLAKELEKEGFNILAPEKFILKSLCPKGILGNQSPTIENKKDIELGFKIAKNIGKNDIGQSLIIQNGLVLTVEAAEGTDAMIARSKILKIGDSGAIFIKVIKPGQDERLDRPVIGINTIKSIHEAGLDGMALEANSVFILNLDEVINYANSNNLFIIGI